MRSYKLLRAELDNDAHRNDLFRISHDIRGQAASFGYDLASDIATSLCRYLERHEHHERLQEPQLKVIDAHISAIRAYLRQSLQGNGGVIGQELMAELSSLVARTDTA